MMFWNGLSSIGYTVKMHMLIACFLLTSFQNWVIDKYSTPNGIRISKIKSAVLSRFPGARF